MTATTTRTRTTSTTTPYRNVRIDSEFQLNSVLLTPEIIEGGYELQFNDVAHQHFVDDPESLVSEPSKLPDADIDVHC